MEDARIPSLSSCLPTLRLGRVAFDQEAGDAAIALFRRGVGEQEKDSGLRGVGNPKFSAGDAKMVAVGNGSRGQGEGVGTGAGLG